MTHLDIIKRAAHILAELPPTEQTGRMFALRTRMVEAIKVADPAYFGLPVPKADATRSQPPLTDEQIGQWVAEAQGKSFGVIPQARHVIDRARAAFAMPPAALAAFLIVRNLGNGNTRRECVLNEGPPYLDNALSCEPLYLRAGHAAPLPEQVERSIPMWQDRIKAEHPRSEPEYWNASIKAHYMEAEILELRAALTSTAAGRAA